MHFAVDHLSLSFKIFFFLNSSIVTIFSNALKQLHRDITTSSVGMLFFSYVPLFSYSKHSYTFMSRETWFIQFLLYTGRNNFHIHIACFKLVCIIKFTKHTCQQTQTKNIITSLSTINHSLMFKQFFQGLIGYFFKSLCYSVQYGSL